MDGRALSRASAFSFQLSLLSCCVSFVRPEMQPFIEEYSSNNCERHVSECETDFSVQLKLAQMPEKDQEEISRMAEASKHNGLVAKSHPGKSANKHGCGEN